MADPTGGIGKASAQLLQEIQKMQEQVASPSKQGVGGTAGQSGFQEVMQAQQVQQANQAQAMQQVQATVKPSKVLQAAKVGVGKDAVTASKVQESTPVKSGLKTLLEDVVAGQNKMDKLLEVATGGKKFSPQELLALQAGVYRFTQELDLTSKVVEKSTSGVKQTMNTQV